MIISIGVIESQLIGIVSPALFRRLRQDLSYTNESHIIARKTAYRKYGQIPKRLAWSGITYLINDKYVFPTGLLWLVRKALEDFEISWSEMTEYEVPPFNPIALMELLEPWKHQREAIDAIKDNQRGIIKIGTGGGKTKASIIAASEIGATPLLFVVNRISLLEQTHEEYTKYLGEGVGFIGDGKVSVGQFNIATIGTLCSIFAIEYKDDSEEDEVFAYSREQIDSVKELLQTCKLVIIDECHHASSATYKLLLNNLPKAVYRIGLSATPYRTDGTEIMLYAAFGTVIYSKSASELIEEGVLRRPKIYVVRYKDPKMTKKFPRKGRGAYNKVYKECVVENPVFEDILARIAIANAASDRLTLVSVKQIAHCERIYARIKSIDPSASAVCLHGKNKKALGLKETLKQFENREFKILISTLLDEGIDIPKMETTIDAGGGRSPIKTLQLTGRAIREEKDKKDPTIFIFVQDYTHLYKHSIARVEILQSEPAFDISVLEWEEISG